VCKKLNIYKQISQEGMFTADIEPLVAQNVYGSARNVVRVSFFWSIFKPLKREVNQVDQFYISKFNLNTEKCL